jgi:sigma-B regulation protein RsbU (phosphoserine phosphatase)
MNHALATAERPLGTVSVGTPSFRAPAVEATTVGDYLDGLLHDWLKTLTTLGFTLIPIFFALDVFMMPRELLPRFALYRLITTAIVIGQHFLVRFSPPTRRSYVHGYLLSLVAGFMIALMTTDLGGFNSTYYAGLNLVMIAVNLVLPWSAVQSAINTVMIIGLYVGLNLLVPQHEPVRSEILINNLYFLITTGVISISISYVKRKLIVQEFHLRADLKKARDALWGEMEVAKRIQTSLLPKLHEVHGYTVAASMQPADEVGGDYYDLVEASHGETWLCIGDVSGHGVESGLIMMMTQTSIFTTVNRTPGQKPSEVLTAVNAVLNKNISRLGADRYVTCMALRLDADSLTFAGKHQDVLIYRARTGTIEQISTEGVWLGIVEDVTGQFTDMTVPIDEGDVLLLFTDGVTEAMDDKRELFGEDRLKQALARSARLGVEGIVQGIESDVWAFMHKQKDDVTVVAVKRSRRS